MLRFSKWEGTGNDFILIDDRDPSTRSLTRDPVELAQRICDRHFGIGSDGLILIQERDGVDFHMDFLNPDGSRSFCGNGSRCAFAFWSGANDASGDGRRKARFSAIDGEHAAAWIDDRVSIGMRDVRGMEQLEKNVDLLHTGSPHLLIWVEDPEAIDLIPEARSWRYNERFSKEGVNVNFIAWKKDGLVMRTYERGVENETLSCGTGVTAAALAAMHRGLTTERCTVRTRGGSLRVEARMKGTTFTDISLIGPARHVFEGSVDPQMLAAG